MAKNTKKTENQTYAERKAAKNDEIQKEFGHLHMHFATVEGPNRRAASKERLPEGTEVEVIWVGASRRLGQLARVIHDGETKWIDPKYLKRGKALPASKKSLYEAEREEEVNATVLIPATVAIERDNSVLLNYSGWFKGMWFSKDMVEKTGATTTDATTTDAITGKEVEIFEIPQWKVKAERGQDSLDYLLKKQAEFAKIVAAAEAA